MTYAEELRQKLYSDSSESIRAVIYARVSTDNEGQKESCANQVELANKFINLHSNIVLKGIYVDDGISGKNDFTRPQYNEMLKQISSGSVDLVITKALSRLNRDELNSLHLKNILVQYETTVFTLEDNQLHDFQDMNSGLLHSLNFAMDAQYVMRQSINGRKTQELRCERKELSAKDTSYGYDWHRDDKSITINEGQAEVVRRIFEDYVYRRGTPASIQKSLKADGINICGRTVSNIILDERYIGKFYINKRTSKLGTGRNKSKRIMLPKKQWVLVERPDLQIVDKDLFAMAQRIHQTKINVYETPDKKTTQARFQGTHKYAGKIFCPVCGKVYQFGYADRKKARPIYNIKSHANCSNPVRSISENDMDEIVMRALKIVIDQQNEVCDSLECILTECVEASQNSGDELEQLKKLKVSRERQIDNLMDTLSEGGLNEAARTRIKVKINVITTEIDNLNVTIQDKESSKLDATYVTDKIAEIKAAIADLRNFTSMDRERILNYIERIELPSNGDINILLMSGQRINIKHNDHTDFDVSKKGSQDGLYSSHSACRAIPFLAPRRR